MHVVVAPDSFKGSLTANEAAECIHRGILLASPAISVDQAPMADGGEGTVRALVAATGGVLQQTVVTGPLGSKLTAEWGLLGDSTTAVIEMAAASGLTLLPKAERNPYYTSTYGTGELIIAALNAGCRRIIVGIGGSATNDGGVGMAQALGVRFFDSEHLPVQAGGLYLSHIHHIDISQLDKRINNTEFIVACDVDNPLYGPDGAAHVYAPQKGASPAMVQVLDTGLRHYAETLMRHFNKDVGCVPGAGAAGGLGAGLMAFVNAKLERGINIVISAARLKERIAKADLVLTGEGRIDSQTARGKTAWGVADLAKSMGVPVIAIGGSVQTGEPGIFSAVFSICPRPLDEFTAMNEAKEFLTNTVSNIMASIMIGRGCPGDQAAMG